MTLARSECSAVLHTEVTQPAWWFSPGWCARGRWEDSRKTGWRFLKVQKWNHRATQRSQLWAFVHRRQKQRLTETSAPLVCRSAVPEECPSPEDPSRDGHSSAVRKEILPSATVWPHLRLLR